MAIRDVILSAHTCERTALIGVSFESVSNLSPPPP